MINQCQEFYQVLTCIGLDKRNNSFYTGCLQVCRWVSSFASIIKSSLRWWKSIIWETYILLVHPILLRPAVKILCLFWLDAGRVHLHWWYPDDDCCNSWDWRADTSLDPKKEKKNAIHENSFLASSGSKIISRDTDRTYPACKPIQA